MDIENIIQRIILSIPGLLFVFTIRGFVQAYTADKLGDPTPRKYGRVTLNPMAHIDPVGFIALALFNFGWGKPINFDTRNFKNIRRDNALTILSGPVATFISGIIFSFLFVFIANINISNNIFIGQLSQMFYFAATISISLSIFYMLPLPGLDGYKLITNFIPYKYYRYLYTIERYGLYIFFIFILLFSRSLSGIINLLMVLLINLWLYIL